MIDDLDRLVELMPPPAAPVDAVDAVGDWKAIETAVGSELPDDYKRFVERYGTGRIAGLLWPLNPFNLNANLNLVQRSEEVLRAEQSLRDEFPQYCPYELFPEKDGLFPWCSTDNGDYIFWRTHGKPTKWTNFIYEIRGSVRQNVPYNMTGFLYQWFIGQIDVEIFDRKPLFEQNPAY